MALRRCIKSESRSTTIVHYTNPEGGDFARITESHHSFRWTRAVALIDPEKDMKYNIDCAFTQEIVSLIQKYGTCTEKNSFPNLESYPRYILTGGELTRLMNNEETTVSNSANWLYSFIESNKPLLMKHEETLLNTIGAVTRDTCIEIIYFVGTGRVSVKFVAATKSLDDAMIVAMIAPPDDRQKRMKVIEWVQSESARYQRVRSELLAKALQISLKETEMQQ